MAFGPTASADTLGGVVDQLKNANGRYGWGSASLPRADCSGLVSVAQSLATGRAPRRLGDTHSLLAGRWPDVAPGATDDDAFVIGANRSHMVARILGVNIESSTSGEPYRFGPDAASPFDPQFTTRFHVVPEHLIAL